jgi:hypothetical protein
MKYAVETVSGPMMYIPNFIKIGPGIQKLMGKRDTETHRQHSDLISQLLYAITTLCTLLPRTLNFECLNQSL